MVDFNASGPLALHCRRDCPARGPGASVAHQRPFLAGWKPEAPSCGRCTHRRPLTPMYKAVPSSTPLRRPPPTTPRLDTPLPSTTDPKSSLSFFSSNASLPLSSTSLTRSPVTTKHRHHHPSPSPSPPSASPLAFSSSSAPVSFRLPVRQLSPLQSRPPLFSAPQAHAARDVCYPTLDSTPPSPRHDCQSSHAKSRTARQPVTVQHFSACPFPPRSSPLSSSSWQVSRYPPSFSLRLHRSTPAAATASKLSCLLALGHCTHVRQGICKQCRPGRPASMTMPAMVLPQASPVMLTLPFPDNRRASHVVSLAVPQSPKNRPFSQLPQVTTTSSYRKDVQLSGSPFRQRKRYRRFHGSAQDGGAPWP